MPEEQNPQITPETEQQRDPTGPGTPNPFDFERDAASFEPALTAVARELPNRLKNMDPQEAARILDQVRKATEEKKSASEILETVFGVIATGVGILK